MSNFTVDYNGTEGDPGIQRAMAYLSEVLGASAMKVSWEPVHDEKGRRLFKLTVSDPAETSSAFFAPDELRSSSDLRSRLYDLWGDVLQAHSNKQVRRLQDLVQQGE